MSEPLGDFQHRVLRLGRVRLGIQRVLLAFGRPDPAGAVPAHAPDWRDEVAQALTGLPVAGEEALRTFAEEEARLDAELRERLEQARLASGDAPGDALRHRLGLDADDEALLWAVAAPALDPALARLYRVLHPTAGAGPLLDFALMVAFGTEFAAMERGRRRLAPGGPLVRWRLLVGAREVDGRLDPALGEPVRLNPAVLAWVGGDPWELPAPLVGVVSVSAAEPAALHLAESFDRQAAAVFGRAARARTARTGMRVWLVGPPGSGRRQLTARLARDMGRPHWVVDAAGLVAGPDGPRRVRELFREARLHGAVLHVRAADAWFPKDGPPAPALPLVLELLETLPSDVFFDSPAFVRPPDDFPFVWWLDVPLPGEPQRCAIWRDAVPGEVGDEVFADLARRYFLTGGRIRAAAQRAVARAARRGGRGRPGLADLAEEARREQSTHLGSLAQRVEHPVSWDGVVLPPGVMAQVREIIDFARHRTTLFESWGFHRTIPYGRGLAVLFSGPPGTGKTMLAGVVAAELGLDLYRIDLAQVTSKYIGETEKHLAALFDDARDAHAALLFDEADALFAKRTDVKSSVDRYANLEVNYLLQRIEAFDGVSILTTNFKQSLDEALLRRIRFKIELPAPDEAERERLWRAMIPAEVPRTEALDLEFLARRYDFAGAQIQSCVVRAAIRAMAAGEDLAMRHLREAADLACQELGRVVRVDEP